MGTNINFSKKNGVPSGTNISIPSVDVDALAFLSTAGIIGETQFKAINNLVKGLKADGLWSKMKAVYPFVTDNRNILSYTEDFGNSYWTKDGVSITPGQTDPTGGTNATRVVGTTPSRSLYGLITLTTGATYTLSCYVKSTSGSNQTFRIYANAGAPFSPDFTATSSWQRVTLTFTAAAGNNSFGVTRDSSTNNYDILVYGIQMELGSTATTYQPIATTQQSFIASQFKYNLVNPVDSDAAFRLVFNGGWTHSSTGATPNGTNGWADTKFIANTNLTKGDGHLSYYSRTNSADSSGSTTMGDNTGGRGRIVLRRTTDIAYMECGTNGADSRTYTVTDSRCYAVANVISNQNVDFFRNGIKQTATAINSSNQGWSTGVIGIGGSIANGQYDNKQCAFSTIGNGLTDTEAANLYTRVQAYQTSLFRQV